MRQGAENNSGAERKISQVEGGTMIAIACWQRRVFMRSNKRYTNQTFTKRGDNEAGRHHTPRAAREPAVCADCGNVYADRRWSKPNPARSSAKHAHFRAAQTPLCPACKAIQHAL